MAVCEITGKILPERNAHFAGLECRQHNRFCCKYFSHQFVDGTNCILLRKPRDVRAILGIKSEVKNATSD